MFLRSLGLGAVGALLVVESAMALSCMRPELAQTMEDAKASDTVYSILVGTFETPPAENMVQDRARNDSLSPEDQFKPKPPVITPAKFSGYALTSQKTTDAKLTEFPVDIETSCIGPWCSSAPAPDKAAIVFVEMRQNQSPILKISPCPQWVFLLREDENQVEDLRACFDETCLGDTIEILPKFE